MTAASPFTSTKSIAPSVVVLLKPWYLPSANSLNLGKVNDMFNFLERLRKAQGKQAAPVSSSVEITAAHDEPVKPVEELVHWFIKSLGWDGTDVQKYRIQDPARRVYNGWHVELEHPVEEIAFRFRDGEIIAVCDSAKTIDVLVHSLNDIYYKRT